MITVDRFVHEYIEPLARVDPALMADSPNAVEFLRLARELVEIYEALDEDEKEWIAETEREP